MELSANIDSYPTAVTTHDSHYGNLEHFYAVVMSGSSSPKLVSRGR